MHLYVGKKIEKNKSLRDQSSAPLDSVEHLMAFLDVISDNEKQQQKTQQKDREEDALVIFPLYFMPIAFYGYDWF